MGKLINEELEKRRITINKLKEEVSQLERRVLYMKNKADLFTSGFITGISLTVFVITGLLIVYGYWSLF